MFWKGDTPFFPILWYAGSKRNAISTLALFFFFTERQAT